MSPTNANSSVLLSKCHACRHACCLDRRVTFAPCLPSHPPSKHHHPPNKIHKRHSSSSLDSLSHPRSGRRCQSRRRQGPRRRRSCSRTCQRCRRRCWQRTGCTRWWVRAATDRVRAGAHLGRKVARLHHSQPKAAPADTSTSGRAAYVHTRRSVAYVHSST